MEITKKFNGTKKQADQLFMDNGNGFIVKWVCERGRTQDKFELVIRANEQIIKKIQKINTLEQLINLEVIKNA